MDNRNPPTTTNKVVIQMHDLFGRSAHAAVPIAAGELAISEIPLLYINVAIDPLTPHLLQLVQQQLESRQHATHGTAGRELSSHEWQNGCAVMLAFARAPDDVQMKVLAGMHNRPEGSGIEHTSPMRRTTRMAEVFASIIPQISQLLHGSSSSSVAVRMLTSPASIQLLLLSYELNAHAMGEGSALFEVGSKLAHTCSTPNTTYMSCGSHGCHVALRDIAAGEVLTTCYFAADNLIMATQARQYKLRESFCFQCCCERCTSHTDYLSALPCQNCATLDLERIRSEFRDSEGHLSSQVYVQPSSSSSSSRSQAPIGLLWLDPVTAASSNICSSSGSTTGAGSNSSSAAAAAPVQPWQCCQCRQQLPDDDVALFGLELAKSLFGPSTHCQASQLPGHHQHMRVELYILTALLNSSTFNDQHDDAGQSETSQLAQLLRQVKQIVGPYHWAAHHVLNKITGCLRGMLLEAAADITPQCNLSDDLQRIQKLTQYISSCVQQTWLWLTDWAGISEEEAAYVMCQPLVYNGCTLLEAAAQLLPHVAQCPDKAVLVRDIQHGGGELLARAEPHLSRLQRWPLPEQHPYIDSIAEAQEAVAAAERLLSKKTAAAAESSGVDDVLHSSDQQSAALEIIRDA